MVKVIFLDEDIVLMCANGKMLPQGTRQIETDCSLILNVATRSETDTFFLFYEKDEIFCNNAKVYNYKGCFFLRFIFNEKSGEERACKALGGGHVATIFSGKNENVLLETKDAFVRVKGKGKFLEGGKINDSVYLCFERNFFLYKYDGDYNLLINTDYTSIKKTQQSFFINNGFPSNEGCFEKTVITFSPVFLVNRERGKTREGNFCDKTIGISFLESLLYNFNDAKEFFESSNKEKECKEAVGDFDEIILWNDVFVSKNTGLSNKLKKLRFEVKNKCIFNVIASE